MKKLTVLKMIFLFFWFLLIINLGVIISLLFKINHLISKQIQVYLVTLFPVLVIILVILNYINKASYYKQVNLYLTPYGYKTDFKTIDSSYPLHLIDSQKISHTSPKMLVSKNWKMVYGEIGKPNLFFDLLMVFSVILSVFTRNMVSASRFSWIKLFKGDYYLFQFENKLKFKCYLTNFLLKQDFERSIENLPRLTSYINHNYIIYTNNDMLCHNIFNEELIEYMSRLNKKISISINREHIHIMISHSNSLLSYKVLKKFKFTDKVKTFKETTEAVEFIYQSILKALNN